jgi:hypothetical protein
MKRRFSTGLMTVAFLAVGMLATVSAPAQKVRLRSHIAEPCTSPSGSVPRWKYSDLFGDGNIAVHGSYSCRGAFIYDISNPDSPQFAAHYNPGNNQQFLEAVVVGNRAYFGSGNGGGVHIVDVTDPYQPSLLGTVDQSHGNGFSSIHEIVIDGNYLYENYNGFSNKLLKVIDISDPANPSFVRDINPTEITWVHAMHIRGNRLFTSGWGNSSTRGRTEIYNISNIATQAPALLGYINDPNGVTTGNNMHSSWTSEDGNYLYSCRETSDGTGDVRVYDISNPATPLIVNNLTMQGLGLNAITPHNPVVKGNLLFVSWYQAGVQVFDISKPASPTRLGQFDTYPDTFAQDPAEKALIDESFDIVCGNEDLQNLLPTSYDGNWAVFPFLGNDKVLAGDMSNGLYILDVSAINSPLKNRVSDFDGDGKTDFAGYSPSSGLWTIERSSDSTLSQVWFGSPGDRLVASDYDGDGRSDVAVWRPSNGTWYIIRSSDSTYDFRQFGLADDLPAAADYDLDGKADVAVFRPSNGVWYIWQSSLGFKFVQWGSSGDIPVTGDFEGDGKADMAVFRPSNGVWYIYQSSSGIPMYAQFGANGDKPLAGDFDGDGRSDFAVYRPSQGTWYVLRSGNGSFFGYEFGMISTDIPIPADFDGDGKSDISVYRPSDNNWYRINSSDSSFGVRNFGSAGDLPAAVSVQP